LAVLRLPRGSLFFVFGTWWRKGRCGGLFLDNFVAFFVCVERESREYICFWIDAVDGTGLALSTCSS
jgi:hypothetical protein